MILSEWGTGSQLPPARQLPSRTCLVGSVLGPSQVPVSPVLLHKHWGLSPVPGCVHMGTGAGLPESVQQDRGFLSELSSMLRASELQGSHPSRNKSHFTKVT